MTAIRPVCCQYLCNSKQRGAVGPPTVNLKTHWETQQAALRTATIIATSVSLPREPHEHHEKAKRYDTRRSYQGEIPEPPRSVGV